MKNLVIIIAAALFLIIHSGPAAAQGGGERFFFNDNFTAPLFPGAGGPSTIDYLFPEDPAELPPMFGLDPGRPLGISEWMFAQLDAILHDTESDQPPITWPGDESEPRGAFFSVFDYMDIWFTTPLSEFRNEFPAPDARGSDSGRFLEGSGDSSTMISVNNFSNPFGER